MTDGQSVLALSPFRNSLPEEREREKWVVRDTAFNRGIYGS
jgi:hypothetical protein